MAFDEGKGRSSESDLDILGLRLGANRIAKGVAAYEAGNEVIVRNRRREALYKNGFTLPVTAERLMAEAERTTRHSTKLTRNMKAAGQLRPTDAAPKVVSAHHVVAATDLRADRSRIMMFRWNIGINDVDNGVYLPAYKNSMVASLSGASKHATIHTDLYHVNVLARLMPVPGNSPHDGRLALRQIKQELINGVFPF